ncbi:hypothetical protein F5144DRAFT_572023 [Chaetomium tenue]|uniref:Uncharacterized protein n=1 Tax=Chaetomium tenue TaxID=1854479 RepID=A0ACB7P6A9_9PEZI|nr:hypothetical protein F5144DRAFT_572023 [Chaetomium globosum]
MMSFLKRRGRIPPGTKVNTPEPPPPAPKFPNEYKLRIYCTACNAAPGNGSCSTAKQLTKSLPNRMAYHDPNYTGTFLCEWELGIDFCSAKAKTAPTTKAAVTEVLTQACGTLKQPGAPAPAVAKRLEPFKVDDVLNGLKAKGIAYKTTPSAFL